MSVDKQVKEFHKVAGIKDLEYPQIPDDNVVRLRAKLITEEYIELINSLFDDSRISEAEDILSRIVKEAKVCVDIVEFSDACADLDYVVAGSRLQFGIEGESIANEVHRSNMTKFPNNKVLRREDGKIIKPDTFESPNIKEILKKQGWK